MLDLTDSEQLKDLLETYHLRLNTNRGQHFLICREPLDAMLAAADISREDTILEIGPGVGTLTLELSRRARQVVAIEIDRDVSRVLGKILRSQKATNVRIVEGDALTAHYDALPLASGEYAVVANLPYQITSSIIRRWTEEDPKPKKIVIMIQREVAERITAQPGDMSILAVAVQFFGIPRMVTSVPRSCFLPVPEVDSSVIAIDLRTELLLPQELHPLFFRVVRIGFSARRKMLKNNLSGGLHRETDEIVEVLKQCGVSEAARAQELSVDEWINILHNFISLNVFDEKRKK